MSTYRGTFGQKIQYLSSDPANLVEGQIWYNSTSNTLKVAESIVITASWATGDNINTGRNFMGGANQAPQTSTVIYMGDTGPARVNNTEEYNGSAWTNQTGSSVGRSALGSTGIQTAAVGWCGYSGGGRTDVEEYNGSSWTSGTSYPGSARYFDGGGTGLQTAALSFGANGTNEVYEYTTGTWTSQTGTPTTLTYAGGFGTQTSSICAGGNVGLTTALSYNGSAWSSENSLNTGRQRHGHAGNSTSAGVVFGGSNDPGSDNELTATEDWDGTSWTSSANLNLKRDGFANGCGTATGALAAAGSFHPGSYPLTNENYTGASSYIGAKTVTTS